MAGTAGRLTVLGVKAACKPGYLCDGNGLYLQISKSGAKSWVLRYRTAGKLREMGLGGTGVLSLADARKKTDSIRRQIYAGIDPIASTRASKNLSADAKTFRICAVLYIDSHKAGWKSSKHAGQWQATLETYAFPFIGELPSAAIETEHILKILKPIWTEKSETAGRVRGRIEAILDYAKARGWRDGTNPATWKGHLELMLPAKSDVSNVVHHAALPFNEMKSFLAKLRSQSGIAARALEFAILTAARTSEALIAVWSEVDLETKVWTIPANRMKGKKEHRVPLNDRAMIILNQMTLYRAEGVSGAYVFPGSRIGRPMSNMAFLMLLRRLNRSDLTAHGFRSTFRDWAGEMTDTPREIAEAALAHSVGNAVESAYRRGDALDKRRVLMAAWAEFCEPEK